MEKTPKKETLRDHMLPEEIAAASKTLAGTLMDKPLPQPPMEEGLDKDAVEALSYTLNAFRTNIEKSRTRLERQLLTDEMTQLSNRRAFDAWGTGMLEELFSDHPDRKDQLQSLALICVDIDEFKQHNDTRGHQHGDDVLRQVAGVLKSHIRMEDMAARIGGDELAVLLRNVTREQAGNKAEELRMAVKALAFKFEDDPDLKVTASLGVTVAERGQRPKTLEELIKEADKALYASKRDGRDRVTLFET